MARVLRLPGFQGGQPRLKGPDPVCWWPRHGSQLPDQVWDDKQRLVPGGGIPRQAFGSGEGGTYGEAPREGQPLFLGVGQAALIARNPAHVQQQLADQPRGVS